MSRKGGESGKTRASRSKGNQFIRHAYLYGFTEEEKASLKSQARPDISYASYLAPEVTHLVLSSSSSQHVPPKEKFYFAAVSGSGIVRESWLSDPEADDKHTWDPKHIDVQCARKATTGPSLLEMLKFYKHYGTASRTPFASPIFSRILFLSSGGENEELISDIRSIIEVGGGSLADGRVEEEIRMRPKSARQHVSLAVYFPGFRPTTMPLVKLLEAAELPIIPHDVILAVVEKLGADVEVLVMEYVKKPADDEEEEREELERTHDGAISSADEAAMEVEEEPRAHAGGGHGGLSPLDWMGMVELGPDAEWPCIDLTFPDWASWVDLFSKYKQLVERLKSEADNPKLFHSLDSQYMFNDIMAEFDKNEENEDVKDLIAVTASAHIRNSECPEFLPSPDALSLLIHKIVLTNTAVELGVPAGIFRTLFFFLRKFPPHSKDSREYWLQVLSPPKKAKEASSKTKRTVTTRSRATSISSTGTTSGSKVTGIAALRRFVKNALSAKHPNMELFTFVLELLETDLYMMQKTEGAAELLGPKRLTCEDEEEEGESVAKRKKTLSDDDIGRLPFAFLMFYEPYEVRKMGIDDKAMKFFDELSRLFSSYEHLAEPLRICARLQAVFLEALRWTFVQRDAPMSQFEVDAKRVLRHCLTLGWSSESLVEQFPIEWIKKLILSANARE